MLQLGLLLNCSRNILCKEPLVNNMLMPTIYAAQACLQRCRNTGIITNLYLQTQFFIFVKVTFLLYMSPMIHFKTDGKGTVGLSWSVFHALVLVNT